MRLLCRCYACNRQYDVSHREPGSQFRCRCTKVLTVPDVSGQSHDSVMVRCSNCGAPRSAGLENCSFCGAAFSEQERDLRMICPSCFTRVSVHASYCHSCGTPIVIEQELGATTALECPVCEGVKLAHRSFGDSETAIAECPRCAGMWISHSLFEQVAREHRQQAIEGLERPAVSSKAEQVKSRAQPGPMYRKCPECGTMMNRQNYGRRSGIIIDTCRDHGMWFDRDELEAILEWLRAGGKERASPAPRPVKPTSALGSPVVPGRSSAFTEFAGETVFEVLFSLFR